VKNLASRTVPGLREPADWERAAVLEVQQLTGELRGGGMRLVDIAVAIRASERQLSAWRAGEHQPPHWAVLALRELVSALQRAA
jgi:hypothetical protein